MVRAVRRHLTYANVAATLALFIALGGTSYAALKLPEGSVGNRQLRDDAVTSAKVKNGKLLAEDFKAGQLPRGRRGPQGVPGLRGIAGPQGGQGLQGLPGRDGAPGVSGYGIRQASAIVGPNQLNDATAFCPTGQRVLGGGAGFGNGFERVVASFPNFGTEAWTVEMSNGPGGAANSDFTAYAICANVQ